MKIRCNLGVILAKKRIEIEDLHKMTGINSGQLSNYKNEVRDNPTIQTAFKISRALEVNIQEIWEVVED